MKHRFSQISRICLISLISFIAGCIPANKVRAQTSGLSITPPVVEILLAPNKKVVQSFSLQNFGESRQFVVNFHSVSPLDADGHVTVSPQPLNLTDLPLILTLNNADIQVDTPFEIGGGATQQLVIGIEGVSSDEPQDAYFALVVSAAPRASVGSSTLPGLSALVLTTLIPTGSLPLQVSISDFDLPLIHDSLTPLNLSATLTNDAPVMIRPEGKLEIISPRGHNSSEIKLYPNLVLRESSRNLQAISQDLPAPLSWQPSWRNFGPYRFRLTATTAGGTTLDEVEQTVWLVPIRAIIILLLLIITPLTLFAYRRLKLPLDTD